MGMGDFEDSDSKSGIDLGAGFPPEIASALPDFVVLIDRRRRYLWVNRLAPGVRVSDLAGKGMDDFIEPASLPVAIVAVERTFATGLPSEYEVDGYGDGVASHTYHTRVMPAPPQGSEPRVLLVTRDITAERRAERKLRETEQRLQSAIATGNIAVWEWELGTDRLNFEGPLAVVLGMNEPGDKMQGWLERTHPDDRERILEAFRAHLRGDVEYLQEEHRMRVPATGEWRWVLNRARLVAREGGRTMIGTTTDVTELRQAEAKKQELERQLERTQRLESVGVLAGGIAHDFNNLLTVILATAEAGAQTADNPAETIALFNDIAATALRASKVTQQLLAFSRQKELAVSELELVALVDNLRSLVRHVLGSSIEVRFERRCDRVGVRGDAGQLEQVLLNLCLNARDAMPKGGQLTLVVEADETNARITVRDTGSGIAPELVEKIFDPFFTTKGMGSGTGLGLSVAHGIVKQHGGELSVRSTLGRGTEMIVCLPRSTSAALPRDEPTPLVTHRGTILYADDEPMLRRLTLRILRGAGFEVVAAQHGLEAVREFDARPDAFALALLDIMMPGLDGLGVCAHLRARRPSLPVVFCSGYNALGELANTERVVEKPYRSEELVRVLLEALASVSEPAETP